MEGWDAVRESEAMRESVRADSGESGEAGGGWQTADGRL